jgi:hypothetical protein
MDKHTPGFPCFFVFHLCTPLGLHHHLLADPRRSRGKRGGKEGVRRSGVRTEGESLTKTGQGQKASFAGNPSLEG